MTRIDKSESQNIAEAAQPLEERDLRAAIELHRMLYRAEVWIPRIHSRTGDGTTTAVWKDSADADPADRPVGSGSFGWTGMSFNPIFAAFLDEEYGAFPWNKALFWLRHRVCRSSHPEHLRLEWEGALCHALVNLVIRHEYSLDAARLKLGLPHEGKSRRTLDSALLTIEKRLEDQLAGEKQRQTPVHRDPAEWMAPRYAERHDQPGLHAEDCPQCRRRRAAA